MGDESGVRKKEQSPDRQDGRKEEIDGWIRVVES